MENKLFTDQLGREVAIPFPPRRIVSVVPSQTELLYHLGLADEVTGITKFCVHPDQWFRSKTRIGGTKQLHVDQIIALQPDLIIANKEENEKSQIDALMEHCPVWVSDIHTLEDACEMIVKVGEITGRATPAQALAMEIQQRFASLPTPLLPVPTAYFIWRNPWMVAANGTFIDQMLQYCGFENIFKDRRRYPEVQLHELRDAQLILLSSEPYPFKAQHMAEIQERAPQARIELVDGEMFSWYGSRLLQSVDYFLSLQATLR